MKTLLNGIELRLSEIINKIKTESSRVDKEVDNLNSKIENVDSKITPHYDDTELRSRVVTSERDINKLTYFTRCAITEDNFKYGYLNTTSIGRWGKGDTLGMVYSWNPIIYLPIGSNKKIKITRTEDLITRYGSDFKVYCSEADTLSKGSKLTFLGSAEGQTEIECITDDNAKWLLVVSASSSKSSFDEYFILDNLRVEYSLNADESILNDLYDYDIEEVNPDNYLPPLAQGGYLDTDGKVNLSDDYLFIADGNEVKVEDGDQIVLYDAETLEDVNMKYICAFGSDKKTVVSDGGDTDLTLYTVPYNKGIKYLCISILKSDYDKYNQLCLVRDGVKKPYSKHFHPYQRRVAVGKFPTVEKEVVNVIKKNFEYSSLGSVSNVIRNWGKYDTVAKTYNYTLYTKAKPNTTYKITRQVDNTSYCGNVFDIGYITTETPEDGNMVYNLIRHNVNGANYDRLKEETITTGNDATWLLVQVSRSSSEEDIDKIKQNIFVEYIDGAKDVVLRERVDKIENDLSNKVGYAEISGTTITLYADDTKENVINAIEIPSVTDDHINDLIDAKLGVIENGTY